MEFSQLNGYKVKDKKAVRFYDNVESMKNDSTLKEGMHVITSGYYVSNDGGNGKYKVVNDSNLIDDGGSIHELTNGLYAKLIINDSLNVKQFGAYGNGTTDDSTIINNAINYCKNNKIKLFMDDSVYLINNSLIIDSNYFDLECIGELKIDSDVNVLIISSKFCNINISSIKCYSNNKLGTAISMIGGAYMNNIKVDNINYVNKGFSLDSSDGSDGLQYNKISFNYLNANYGMYLNGNNAWVNQNYFYGGIVNGENPIYTESITESIGEYNGNTFYDIGFESCVYPITLNNANKNTFKNFRLFEASVTGNYFVKLNNSHVNLFESNTVNLILRPNKIIDNTTTKFDANIFNCMITANNNNEQYASKCLSYNNTFEIIENNSIPTFKYLENNNYSTIDDKLAQYTQFSILNNNQSEVTITLDIRYYYNNPYTYNLVMKLINVNSNNQILIKDHRGNTLFNLQSAITRGEISNGDTVYLKFSLIENRLYYQIIS